MRIENMKINGISNPVGFQFDKILCSWTVADAISRHQANARIEVSTEPDFSRIVCVIEGKELACREVELVFEPKPYTTYFYRITVIGDKGDEAVSGTAIFETAKIGEPWCARWIGTKREDTFHPVLFKSFETKKTVRKARIYICGLGLYEAYLNDRRIGNEYLAPFINDYRTGLQYQTYDITTDLLAENTSALPAENDIRIYLGNGWYKGRFGLKQTIDNYGDRMAAIAEIRIEYADGSIEVIPTDTSWQYQGSDVEDSGIYDGEVFNRRLWKEKDNSFKPVETIDLPLDLLVERYSIPVLVREEIRPAALLHTSLGESVLDMGQNFAGYMEFDADFPDGTKVILDFGEVLQQGNFYNDNYRSAKAQFTYISDGRQEKVRPHFTYYGFRYVRVTGWPGDVDKDAFTGKVVYSDLSRTGFFETSDAKINRLYQNCMWSQKSNFIDIPTDCPQRDERLGWTGDAQVFAATASYNMDTRAFYRKFLRDLRAEQVRGNGAVPIYIPAPEGMGDACSVWGDAATFMPSQLYLMYGNLSDMDTYYPMMRDWVDYITREDEKNGSRHLYLTGFQFGDWLAQDGVTPSSFKGGTDDSFIASAYYYRSAELLSEMAERLGKPDDQQTYARLAEQIKEALLAEYFSPNGRLAIDTQTAYIIALKFGIYMDKDRVIAQFLLRLKKDCYEIKCGFVGAPLLCTTLCENGLEDLAYQFLFKEEFPSWLYCVNLGATTIWERWNSLLEDGTISGTQMNSFNHYAYGSVVEFLYAYVGGIRPGAPGFAKAILAPVLTMKLRHADCTYYSVSGKYIVNWQIAETGEVSVHIEIPFACTAEVILPGSAYGTMNLESGIYDYVYSPLEDYRSVYSLGSRLSEFEKDREAMTILQEELPVAAGMIAGGDKENKSLTLGELFYLSFMGFEPASVQKAADRLLELKRW